MGHQQTQKNLQLLHRGCKGACGSAGVDAQVGCRARELYLPDSLSVLRAVFSSLCVAMLMLCHHHLNASTHSCYDATTSTLQSRCLTVGHCTSDKLVEIVPGI